MKLCIKEYDGERTNAFHVELRVGREILTAANGFFPYNTHGERTKALKEAMALGKKLSRGLGIKLDEMLFE